MEIEAEEKQILKAVKTYLGLQLFGENTFNRINNEEDVFMEKAITILDSLTD